MTTADSSPPAPAAFDARALTGPVDRAAVRAFARSNRGRGSGRSAVRIVFLIIFGAFFVGIAGSILTTAIGMFASFGTGAGGSMPWTFVVVPAVIVVGGIAVLVTAIVRAVTGARAATGYRLSRFAAANGMSYDPGMDDPVLPGMIFSLGHSRHSQHLVRGRRPRFVEVGNYRYTTGSGKNATTHHWGYVAVKLDVPLPNIVLDATGNDGLFGSNLPAAFDRHQRLGLEGDFDRYFSLYCPAGYEQDALYLFTPDIMARFIDNAAALDVEIVDDWLFLYAQRDLSTLDPALWSWLFTTIGAILGKMDQWAHWRDDRLMATRDASAAATAAGSAVTGGAEASTPTAPATAAPLTPPPAGVAAGGRRLRTRTATVPYLIGGAIIVFWIVKFIVPLW